MIQKVPADTNEDWRPQIAGLLPELRAFARFLVRGSGEADDLVQEAVMRALVAQSQYQHGTSVKAWLFTILRNLFHEQRRRRQREARALQAAGTPARTTPPDAHDRLDLADLQDMLWQLPPLLREALVLVGAQGMNYEEAAVICGVPVGTMKARVSRARTTLAKLADGKFADQ